MLPLVLPLVHPVSSVQMIVHLLRLVLLLVLQLGGNGPLLEVHESRRLFLVRVPQSGAVVRAVGVAGVVVEGAVLDLALGQDLRLLSKCVEHHA